MSDLLCKNCGSTDIKAPEDDRADAAGFLECGFCGAGGMLEDFEDVGFQATAVEDWDADHGIGACAFCGCVCSPENSTQEPKTGEYQCLECQETQEAVYAYCCFCSTEVFEYDSRRIEENGQHVCEICDDEYSEGY